ncbi:MAG: peptidylprolyl isomerase [Pseudomonadales bacterium]|nr:peptidylprolyl isomerase [Pseudomonadales bacterium]
MTDAQASARPDYLQADKVSTVRAMSLYGLGVCVGLVLGGIALFNARGTTTNTVPPENMALVNQRPILRSDFVTQLEDETGIPFEEAPLSEKLRVFDAMLREELMVQRGLELDFAETDQDARYALYAAVEQQTIADAAINAVTEEQLRAYYEEHRDTYMSRGVMTVHHLLIPATTATAEKAWDTGLQAVQALRLNKPLDEVKQAHGLEEADFYQRDFYYSASYHLGNELYTQALALQDGEVSDPLLLEDGVHLLQMVSHILPQPNSFDEARKQVEQDFRDSEKARLMDNMVEFLRERATILISEDIAGDYKPEDFNQSQTP